MPHLAREVLELQHGVSAALCRLGSNLNHMLVDEFQDTSREQWDALRPLVEEALSRGGSFTWVGDVKQAIYGWRGGDAALFDGVLQDQGLRAIAPPADQTTLDVNWRSREAIVHCNNAVFSCLQHKDAARAALAPLMAADCPPEILGAAAAALSRTFADAAQKVRADGARGGYVTLTPLHAADANALTDAVREALRARLLDDMAARRPWGDVTILVRSNGKAMQVANWLMEWGIPVITENSLLLAEHPLVAETLAWLTWLDCPQDDVAFWTVLTGSLMAPCLERPDALHCALPNHAPPEHFSPDRDAAHRPVPNRSVLDGWAATRRKGYASMAFKESFPAFWRQWFAPFHSRANLLSPYDTVQEWYRLLGVDARFPESRTFLRRLLEVVHTAAERGYATLGAFLEYWTRNGGDEKVPMPAHTDAVQIMTIHKSKGLQFPVVIVPWMNFSLQDASTPVPHAVEDLRILAPLCKEMGGKFYAAQADAAREALNLWYVAWTRPEEELHVFHTTTPGHLRKHNLARTLDALLPEAGFALPFQHGSPPQASPLAARPADQPAASAAPDEFLRAGQEDAQPVETAPPTAQKGAPASAQEGAPIAAQEGAPLPEHDDDWRPMQWLPRLKIYRNPLQELAFTAKRRGILMHHCLERLALSGDTEEDARRAALLGLRTFPLPVPHEEQAVDDIARALSWYAALPDAALWMRHGLPEQSIMDAAGRLHRVDLLIPPAPGAGWIAVDYKTGEEDAAHPQQIRRYLEQLDALPDSAGLPPSHGVLVYLDLQRCRTVTRQRLSALTPAPVPPPLP